MQNSTKAILAISFTVLVLAGCAGKRSTSEDSWLRLSSLERVSEDQDWTELSAALTSHLEILNSKSTHLQFGPHKILSTDLASALNWCLQEARQSSDPHAQFFKLLRENFFGVQLSSVPSLVTGYYQPVYQARLKPEGVYTQPLYQKPTDLLTMDLQAFQQVYSGEHLREFPAGMRLRGRVLDGTVVPYLSRREIDQDGALKGRGLEIAYVDPKDAFFLQIQGSGKLLLPGQRSFWVGYADQNGHPYLAVGRRLRDHITSDRMGMDALRRHMSSLSPEELSEFLAQNPSYVFFERRAVRATGSLGPAPRDGRTVAVDPAVLSLGGIGFLEFQRDMSPRLVLFQDTGGAIKGHRVDLFMGEGDEAGALAGELKAPAHLTVLLPTAALLSRLHAAGP